MQLAQAHATELQLNIKAFRVFTGHQSRRRSRYRRHARVPSKEERLLQGSATTPAKAHRQNVSCPRACNEHGRALNLRFSPSVASRRYARWACRRDGIQNAVSPHCRVDLPTFPDHRPRQACPNSPIDSEARFIDELGNPIGFRRVRHAARTSLGRYTLLLEKNRHDALSVQTCEVQTVAA